jgi:hypothetical protein
MAELAVAKPPVGGLRQGSVQWLRPELRVRVRQLKAKGVSDSHCKAAHHGFDYQTTKQGQYSVVGR